MRTRTKTSGALQPYQRAFLEETDQEGLTGWQKYGLHQLRCGRRAFPADPFTPYTLVRKYGAAYLKRYQDAHNGRKPLYWWLYLKFEP